MNCFNCGEDGHGVRHCSKHLDTTKITANKIKYFEKKDGGKSEINFIKDILFEVCQSLDADDSRNDEDERDVFAQFYEDSHAPHIEIEKGSVGFADNFFQSLTAEKINHFNKDKHCNEDFDDFDF
jgi:hypothetical protein